MIRLGLVTPSSNTVMEPDAAHLVAARDDVSVHATRIPVRTIGLDRESTDAFEFGPTVEAARLLADAPLDVLAWGGTSGSWLGVARDRDLCASVAEATGWPCTTSTLAVLEALRALGASRIALATPYTADVDAAIAEEYHRQGVEVVAGTGLGLRDNAEFGRQDAPRVRALLREAVGRDPDVDAVAVVCTNLGAARSCADAEAELGVPVVDSVVVTVWHALALAGETTSGDGHGRLWAGGTTRARLGVLVDELRAAVGCDRTTLRLDHPGLGADVDLPVAEGRGPGVRSLLAESSLDQRALETVRWIDEQARTLVQPRFDRPPYPPDALREIYGVRAQILAPVVRDGRMVAWLSAHSRDERAWGDAERAAVDRAAERVARILDENQTGEDT